MLRLNRWIIPPFMGENNPFDEEKEAGGPRIRLLLLQRVEGCARILVANDRRRFRERQDRPFADPAGAGTP